MILESYYFHIFQSYLLSCEIKNCSTEYLIGTFSEVFQKDTMPFIKDQENMNTYFENWKVTLAGHTKPNWWAESLTALLYIMSVQCLKVLRL
jgi:hypothetical protein